MKVTDSLDPGAGAYLERKIGDQVQAGEVIGTVLSNDESAGQAAASAIAAAYRISPEPAPAQEIILGMYP